MDSSSDSELLKTVLTAIKKYPLCDRCLGRMTARLGYGWSNSQRGDAIKRFIIMHLHWKIREGDDKSKEIFVEIAPNIGSQAAGLYRKITGEDLKARDCYICGNILDGFLDNVIEDAEALLKAFDIRKFVVGVRLSNDVAEREEEVKRVAGFPYGESIKSEIRRELGKTLQARGAAQVDFDDPEAMIIVEFPSGEVDIQVNSLLVKGRYRKLARNISQAYWPGPEGPRYFSIEEALTPILSVTGGERVVIHAAGREDVDARMLGRGRPLIVEVKVPRKRRVPLEKLEAEANRGGRGLVEFKFEGYARRREVSEYKSEDARLTKVYRALIHVDGGVSEEELRRVEEELRGRVILQRTPKRVLHRRPDILRRRRVFEISCKSLQAGLAECMVRAEGGLYIKELVSGDDGRTTPSISEIIGRNAVCLELDVLMVEEPWESSGEA